MDRNTVIETNNICKSFNGYDALKNISLSVKKGEISGFIGKNGAGKTTFMRIICGLMKPTEGTVNTDASLSFLPQNVRFRDNMTAAGVIDFFGAIKGCDVSETVKLSKELDIDFSKKINSLSPGQQRKLQLAIATIGAPNVLVLDEPTAGLDPMGVQQVRSIIKKLNEKGSTIFISSHVLKELENLCSSISVIEKGEILYKGQYSNVYEIETEGIDSEIINLLKKTKNRRFEAENNMLIAEIERNEVPWLLQILYEKNIKVFGVRQQGIEKLYNNLIKEG